MYCSCIGWGACPRVLEEMQRLKAEGKVRVLGTSIHDRKRAGEIAAARSLDLLMIRYNAAHPGAEQDIFPRLLETSQVAPPSPAIVAYTATAWRKLIRRPKGWQEPMPSAGDCYRFCLSNPPVDVALMGPKNVAQLDENLRVLEQGPLSPEEHQRMLRLGRLVHG